MMITILLFIMIFGVVVFSHEFGHFLVATLNGIHVREFCMGMGPKLFSVQGKKTLYSIRLFPIGGACIFDGDPDLDDEETLNHLEKSTEWNGDFLTSSPLKRLYTVVAGPLFNFLLAFLLGLILAGFCGTDVPIVQGLMENGAAQEAGIEVGDRLLSINGERIYTYREVSMIALMNAGEDLDIIYEREGQKHQVHLTPRYNEEVGRYYIGLLGSGEFRNSWNPFTLCQYSFYEVEYMLRMTFKSLSMLIHGQASMKDISGPVGMASVVGDTYEAAKPYGGLSVFLTMVNMTLLLTVNLGVLNLLPLPALDGGRLVFIVLELLRGKPIPRDRESYVHGLGFAMFFALMIFVFFNDIFRLLA